MIGFDKTAVGEVESALLSYVKSDSPLHDTIFSSMEYSLMAGGKRLRPLLLLAFCELCGGDRESAMPYACALEMIHSYSLIHDDLPCMDNDDMRRGKPTNHKVYGEGLAVVAGDAMQALAFDVMLREDAVKAVGAEKAVKAAGILAKACGVYGMCGGQAIDLEAEGKQVPLEVLQKMDKEKTGALICAAALMGCALAGASEEETAAAEEFAADLGLAFQIEDDLLDVCGNTETLGKIVGSDAANEKSTYVSLLGIEKAKETVNELTEKAVAALSVFGDKAEPLAALCKALANRSF